jgi:hypothetical protein
MAFPGLSIEEGRDPAEDLVGVGPAPASTDPAAHHGEEPVSFPAGAGCAGRDIPAGDVLCLADDTTVGRRRVSEVGAALRPRLDGGAVLGIGRGFAPDGACTSSAGAVRERARGGGATGPRRWWPPRCDLAPRATG